MLQKVKSPYVKSFGKVDLLLGEDTCVLHKAAPVGCSSHAQAQILLQVCLRAPRPDHDDEELELDLRRSGDRDRSLLSMSESSESDE